MANTSMAMISSRLKEIGIRKTLGSANKQILIQFLFEMGIVTALAFVVALSTANFTSGSVFGLFGVSFIMTDVDTGGIIMFVAIFLLITTMLCGLIPALYAWKFQPVAILRNSVKLKGVSWLSKVLTVAQYSFSITVLIAGFTFAHNADFVEAFDYGYEKESMFDLQLGSNEFFNPIKQQVDQIPGVITAGTKNHFGNYGNFGDRIIMQIDTGKYEVDYYQLGEDYLDIMGLKMISGRSFIRGSQADKSQSIIVNNAFGKQHFSGQDPLNQVIKIDGIRKTIVGITADILDHVYKGSQPGPTIFTLADEADFTHLIVKVENNDMKVVEDKLKLIWSDQINRPYNGFLQKDVAMGEAGKDSANLKKIFLSMAFLGCFLSIVGIYSLASLNVAKRKKEMSIRKVLGASFRQLLLIINGSFGTVLIISLFVGILLGYFISDAVLSMIYDYYVDVSILNSVIAGGTIVILSVIMITTAVFRPASANPVVGLRDE
jgi:ABC-type antimicrobial peptide transport system permease subunit